MSKSISVQNSITPNLGDDANLGFTGATLVSALPCPAVIVWPDGRIISANENAKDLVVMGGGEAGPSLRSDLLPQVRKIAENGSAENWVIRTKKLGLPGVVTMSYSLTGVSIPLPGKAAPVVLIFGADNGLEQNLKRALIASRAFYQDLANCSSDFAWSTDHRGIFTFINQRGVAGYRADAMHGGVAAKLVSPRTTPQQAESVFKTRSPVSEVEIWLKGADGDHHCFMMSAVPVFDDDGEWTGARGIGRNVTEVRAREAELLRARRSEKLINTVLRVMRSEVDPQQMLATAAAAVIDVVGMSSCWIFQRKFGELFKGQSASILNIVPRASLDMKNAPDSDVMRAMVESSLQSNDATVSVLKKNGWSFLIAKTRYGGQLNGALCFVRKIDDEEETNHQKPDWDPFDHSLIKSVADQLSVAIAQSEHQENLKILSQTDGLTGLLNRRAFIPEANRRLAHHARKNRKAAFLFIDLDNFKNINDTDGHARGDEILCAVAELIKKSSRESDLAARFGGDEFVIWLEEVDDAIATLKANDLIVGCQDIIGVIKDAPGHHSNTPHSGEMSFENLGMSIGIAIYEPGTGESMDNLICRADQALYEAKKDGKGGYRIAKAASPDGTAQDESSQKDQRGSAV